MLTLTILRRLTLTLVHNSSRPLFLTNIGPAKTRPTGPVAPALSGVRFEQIYRYLHLANSSNQVPAEQPGHDKLFKVSKLLDLITLKFESEFVVHQSVSIDEAMIASASNSTSKTSPLSGVSKLLFLAMLQIGTCMCIASRFILEKVLIQTHLQCYAHELSWS